MPALSNSQHTPVLMDEVLEFIITDPEGRYVDCTGGLGGHSEALLNRLQDKAQLWVCDYHEPTANGLKAKFKNDNRVKVLNERFSAVFDNLVPPFSGVLADFGISSPQLEDPLLGIGFNTEAPLDMRIDNRLTVTAADVLKDMPEEELASVFFVYGGERASRRIARAIVSDRDLNKFYTTTTELKLLAERVLGRFYRGKKIHPATKIFQALRIYINQELQEIETLIQKASAYLSLGGRLVLISFHEGEDRLVKNAFKTLEATGAFKRVVRKSIKPSREELVANPRSRSAKLRVLERLN